MLNLQLKQFFQFIVLFRLFFDFQSLLVVLVDETILVLDLFNREGVVVVEGKGFQELFSELNYFVSESFKSLLNLNGFLSLQGNDVGFHLKDLSDSFCEV